MIYLIFSDIHSNLEALEAFAGIAARTPHDKKICLGDIVGYAADPNACVDWVRANADLALAGNHDYAVVGKTNPSYFNPYAFHACLWTQTVLSAENYEYLGSLQARQETKDILWVHSTPVEPEAWHYLHSVWDAESNFGVFSQRLCFYGHTHRPVIFEQNSVGEITKMHAEAVQLNPAHRYIINVGSIGQPRDGNPESAFAIYDSDMQLIEIKRFSYDYESAQKKIVEQGLPEILAERLSYGL